MNILVLEAYDGGSHGEFLDGLIHYSGHNYTRIGMAARKWKWRMRGSAIYFTDATSQMPKEELEDIDLILTSDMTAVSDLKALLPNELKSTPIVCYFHENQLTYPMEDEAERDYQYAFTNIISALSADAIWFNSTYHRDVFTDRVDWLIGKMPDYTPKDIGKRIADHSRIMPLGIRSDCIAAGETRQAQKGPVTILWNHRWEYDKNPDTFFNTLFELDEANVEFNLIVAGQQFRTSPPIFETIPVRLKKHLIHFGFAANRDEYLHLLAKSDIVVSTAIHEYFGISVWEAISTGCYPVLPNRLSYPELIPATCHNDCLYKTDLELKDRLTQLCQNGIPEIPDDVKVKANELSWPNLVSHYDRAFNDVLTA